MAKRDYVTVKDWETNQILRKLFPYGVMLSDEGVVVFFNRKYEALSFGGVREFRVKQKALQKHCIAVQDDMFLMTDDGKKYVGKMGFFYNDETAPYVGEKKSLNRFFHKYQKIIEVAIGTIGNPYGK